jgi:uncharacterized protein
MATTASCPPHLPDILPPSCAWCGCSSGISHDEVAELLARAGIKVIQDRCLMVDHRRFRR